MELKWAHFCEDPEFEAGVWTFRRIADGYGVRSDDSLAIPDTLYLPLLVHGHAHEEGLHELRMVIRDRFGHSYSDQGTTALELRPVMEGYPLIGPKRITLSGWNLPGKAGDLIVDLTVDGQRLGRVPLFVYPPGSTPTVPAGPARGGKPPKKPIRLLWGHVAQRAQIHPEDGTITLEEVSEFTAIPPAVDGVVFDPGFLACVLVAHPSVEPEQQVTVTPVDPDGQPVAPRHTAPIQFRTHRPGADLRASVLLNLGGLLLTGEGTFEFRIDLGGKFVDAVPFVVHRRKL